MQVPIVLLKALNASKGHIDLGQRGWWMSYWHGEDMSEMSACSVVVGE